MNTSPNVLSSSASINIHLNFERTFVKESSKKLVVVFSSKIGAAEFLIIYLSTILEISVTQDW